MIQKCHRLSLESLCRSRGVSLGGEEPFILAKDGDVYTIDTGHPAYPRGKTNPTGLLSRAANFAVAAANHIAAGAPMASEEEIASRYAICSQCEFLVNDSCAKCGCGISRIRGYVSKLSWADQECPVGKWGKAMPPKEGPPPTS